MGSDELVPVMSITPDEAVKESTDLARNQIKPELPVNPFSPAVDGQNNQTGDFTQRKHPMAPDQTADKAQE